MDISNIPNSDFLDQFLEKIFISREQFLSIFSPSKASVAPMYLLYIIAIMGANIHVRVNSPAAHKENEKNSEWPKCGGCYS